MNTMTKDLFGFTLLAALVGGSSIGWAFVHEPPVTTEARLIGFGCGPGRLTLLAVEEDEFPVQCEAIEPVEEACSIYITDLEVEQLAPQACRDFWGDGY